MYFKKYKPDTLFSKYIEWYFTIDMSLPGFYMEHLVIPDGTFGLIFLEHDNAMSRSLCAQSSRLPLKRTSVFGQKTNAVNYSLNFVGSKVFGIKIKPAGMHLFVKHVHSIKDRFIDIDTLNNKDLLQLEDRVLASPTIKEKIKSIEDYILQHLKKSPCTTDLQYLEKMVDLILTHKGNIQFNSLINYFNINYKKAERLFLKYIGLTPKTYIRIIRFNTCVNHYNTSGNLTQMAFENGFFDQSHFIKEFKQFTSLTPRQFLKKEYSLSQSESLNIINNRL